MFRQRISLVIASLCLTGGVGAAEDVAELTPVRVALIGDSTVASYPEPPADRPGLTGWGQVFDEFFNDRVTVLNHAASGHSSKSFIGEGLWRKTLEAKPDYVFIQFGHNDQPGKGERSTDVNSDYQEYLRQYVKDARAIGAKPVFVTPVTRRTFQDGKPHTTLPPYAEGDAEGRRGIGRPGHRPARGELGGARRTGRGGQRGLQPLGLRPVAFLAQGRPRDGQAGRRGPAACRTGAAALSGRDLVRQSRWHLGDGPGTMDAIGRRGLGGETVGASLPF